MRWLGKSQPGKHPCEGSICHKSKCYHCSLGRASPGTNSREMLKFGGQRWMCSLGRAGAAQPPPKPWEIQVWRGGGGGLAQRIWYSWEGTLFTRDSQVLFHTKPKSQIISDWNLNPKPCPSSQPKLLSPAWERQSFVPAVLKFDPIHQSSSVTHTFLSLLRKSSPTPWKWAFVGVLHAQRGKNTPGLKNEGKIHPRIDQDFPLRLNTVMLKHRLLCRAEGVCSSFLDEWMGISRCHFKDCGVTIGELANKGVGPSLLLPKEQSSSWAGPG